MRKIFYALNFSIIALICCPLSSNAQSNITDADKRKALVPHIRSATDCVADAIRKNTKAMDEARQGNWSRAVALTDWPEICASQLDKVVYWHDKFHGRGTGWDFLLGPYSKDLPRGIASRMRLEFAITPSDEPKQPTIEDTLKAERWYRDADVFISEHSEFFNRDKVLLHAFDGVVRSVNSDPINSNLTNRQQLQKAYDLLLSSIYKAREGHPNGVAARITAPQPPPPTAPLPTLASDRPTLAYPASTPKGPSNPLCNPMALDPTGRPWPSTATVIGPDRSTASPSQLTIDNSRSTSNIYVKLASSSGGRHQDIQDAYIPAGRQIVMRGIDPGSYVVKYKDVESGCNSISELFEIEQRKTYSGIEYTDMTITIYKIASGNFNFRDIPESDF